MSARACRIHCSPGLSFGGAEATLQGNISAPLPRARETSPSAQHEPKMQTTLPREIKGAAYHGRCRAQYGSDCGKHAATCQDEKRNVVFVQNTIGRVMRQMHSGIWQSLRRAAGKIDDYEAIVSAACPIAVCTGTSSSERVSFRQINKKTRKMRRGASGRRRCSLGQLNVSIDHRVADATHDVHASTNKCSGRPQGQRRHERKRGINYFLHIPRPKL